MQNKISGWALGLNGKFWGLIYSDGYSTTYGWTDDVDKIEIDSNSKDMPKTKVWFVCADSHYRDEVNKGEWYYIEVVKILTVIK